MKKHIETYYFEMEGSEVKQLKEELSQTYGEYPAITALVEALEDRMVYYELVDKAKEEFSNNILNTIITKDNPKLAELYRLLKEVNAFDMGFEAGCAFANSPDESDYY